MKGVSHQILFQEYYRGKDGGGWQCHLRRWDCLGGVLQYVFSIYKIHVNGRDPADGENAIKALPYSIDSDAKAIREAIRMWDEFRREYCE